MGARLLKLLTFLAFLTAGNAQANICQFLTLEGNWRSDSISVDKTLKIDRQSIREALENPEATAEKADHYASKVTESGEVDRIASITPFRLAIRAVRNLYRSIPGRLERRYGRTQAKIIMGTLIVGNIVLLPIPGSSIMVGLPPVLFAETYLQLRKWWGRPSASLYLDGPLVDGSFRRLTDDELVEAVVRLRAEIQRTWFEQAGWQAPR